MPARGGLIGKGSRPPCAAPPKTTEEASTPFLDGLLRNAWIASRAIACLSCTATSAIT
jgi:hypothetical protein